MIDNILKIFDTEDKTELKQAFKEIIKDQFRSDLEQMDVYLFDPNDIEEKIQEAFDEIIDDFKKDYKEKLKERMAELIDKRISKIK